MALIYILTANLFFSDPARHIGTNNYFRMDNVIQYATMAILAHHAIVSNIAIHFAHNYESSTDVSSPVVCSFHLGFKP